MRITVHRVTPWCSLWALFFLLMAVMIIGGGGWALYLRFVNPGYFGPFRPDRDDNQIAVINSRVARAIPCSPKDKSVSWPTLVDVEPKRRFARKVTDLGATAGSAGMLEIDREVVELAIQVAVDQGTISRNELENLRQRAERQLFKPNSRSFILVHKYDEPLIMKEEPVLLSERQSSGRLVGMSMAAARGFPSQGIGLLVFEDRVCKDDVSFIVKFPDLAKSASFFGAVDNEFLFGGESNILKVIATAYGQYVPEAVPRDVPGAIPRANRTISVDAGEFIGLGQLALDIVKLIRTL